MKKSIRMALVQWSAAALVAGCAVTGAGTTGSIPEKLRAPGAEVLSLETAATGVQIYECRAGRDDPKRFSWVFRAPEADLFDRSGKKIGTHYAGPTWELEDGSKVVAAVTARDDAPEAGAVPWLLLVAKSTAGDGVLTRTRSIQRVRTVGGTAPADGCGEAQAGKVARVDYKAVYYFYAGRQ